MSNQYFENNKDLKSIEKEISFFIKGKNIKFTTDLGVFSKGGVDFGSSQLLKNIKINDDVKTILDVGCGYGTIGLTIALLYKNTIVDMVDVNLRAIELAKKNAILNSIINVNIFECNVYQNIHKTYDLIVTNPPIRAGKKVVHQILIEGQKYLNDHGSLWCVIQKKQGALSAIKVLDANYQEVIIHCKEKRYYIIEAKK